LKSDLFEARRRGDVLIATFHVTGPALYARRPELRQAVELALSAGARVVAAHGTHAVAAVERRGDAVIAWGLGNVAFACDCTDEADAVLMRVRFEGTSEGTKVAAVELLPIDAGLDGGPARPSEDAAGILALLRSIGSSPFRSEGGRGVLEGL
jgi:poly-gamma-glutamate synthesis protein (capsule biosynthesis protein)